MNDPVAMRRRLRAELRRLRAQANLTQREVATSLDWSPSKVIRIENGTVAISVTDLRALLALYELTDQQSVEQLVSMARSSKKQPFGEYQDILPLEIIRYLGYESSASIIRQMELNVVPGLLQTEEYTRALLQAQKIDDRRIDRLVESRRERQELLDGPNPPEMFFILDEAVLRRAIGGSAIMQRQLEHLAWAASKPRITVQVLPFDLGAHPGLLRGPFVYLEFPSEDDPDVLHIENPSGDAVIRDQPEVTGPYLERFFELEDLATRPEAFSKFLEKIGFTGSTMASATSGRSKAHSS